MYQADKNEMTVTFHCEQAISDTCADCKQASHSETAQQKNQSICVVLLNNLI